MDYREFFRKLHDRESVTADDCADAIESVMDELDHIIERCEKQKEEAHMGAFDVVPNIVIPDPDDPKAAEAFRKKWGWEPHEQVIIRGAFTAGDQEIVTNASTQASKDGKIILQAGSGRTALLAQMIVDWTLAQNGRRVEVTPQHIKRLPANYSNPILEQCDKLAAAMTQEEQEDFLPSANGHIGESSTTVKPSLKRS